MGNQAETLLNVVEEAHDDCCPMQFPLPLKQYRKAAPRGSGIADLIAQLLSRNPTNVVASNPN